MAETTNVNTQSVNQTLNVKAGATYTAIFTVKEDAVTPLDITGWTAEMQVRAAVGAPTAELTFSTSNGSLVIDGPNGTVTLVIDPADTNGIATYTGGRIMYYDLEIDNGLGVRYAPFEGCFVLHPQITITE